MGKTTTASRTKEVAWLTGAAKDDALVKMVVDGDGNLQAGMLNVLANDPGSASLYGVYTTANVYRDASTKTPLDSALTAVTTLGGSVSIVNGMVAYTPPSSGPGSAAALVSLAAGESVADTFYYVIWMADKGAYSLASATVLLTGVDDAAVIQGDTSGAVVEDVVVSDTGALQAEDPDHDQDGFQAATVAGDWGNLSIDVAGAWEYTLDHALADPLNEGDEVVETLTVLSIGGTPQEIAITVTGTNDAPTANADTASTDENTPIVIDVLANDTDPDSAAVLSLVGVSTNGIAFDPGTAYDHLPAGAQATVTINYTMEDEHGAQSSSSVEVTVNGVNDPATITGDVTGLVVEDGILSVSGTLVVSDVDDGEAVLGDHTDLAGTYGDFTLASAGDWLYTLRNDDAVVQDLGSTDVRSDTLTVWSSDESATTTIEISIQGADEAALNPVKRWMVNQGQDTINGRYVWVGFDDNDIIDFAENLHYTSFREEGMDTIVRFDYDNKPKSIEVVLVGYTDFDPAGQVSLMGAGTLEPAQSI